MNTSYLVIARCPMDDVPIFWSRYWMKVEAFVSKATKESALSVAHAVLGWDTSDVICLAVVTFDKGLPISCEIIKYFDKEEVSW